MQDNQLVKVLKDIGLTEHESQVYLAVLKLGPATVLQIARMAEVKRTTVYPVVEVLKQKGLISTEVRGLKRRFVAANPEQLDVVLQEKRKQFTKALPELKTLYSLQGQEGVMKYYEGLEAIKTVYEALLRDVKPHDEYLVMSDDVQWFKLDPLYFKKFLRRRAKLNIQIRTLLQDSPEAREHQKFEKNFHEKVKILPPHTKLTTNLVIIPQCVVIHQMIPPLLAIVIENKSTVQLQKEIFDIVWNSIQDK